MRSLLDPTVRYQHTRIHLDSQQLAELLDAIGDVADADGTVVGRAWLFQR